MSENGDEDFEGDFDEEILFEDEEIVDSESEEAESDEDETESVDDDNEEEEVIVPVEEVVKKFKDNKKIKINTVLQKSNTPRTIIVVPDHKKQTDHRLHRSELSNIISMRTAEIDTYGTHFASLPVGLKADDIAIKELYERRCPLMVERIIGYGLNGETIVEIWDVNTMTLPPRHTI